MNSSWLDPEGSEPSRIPLGGWLSFGGSCVEEFSSMVREPFWVSSTTGSLGFLFVCAIEGCFQAGNTVGATVGFVASLQPKPNAYTKMALSKTAEFRPLVNTCRVQVGSGVFIPPTFVTQ